MKVIIRQAVRFFLLLSFVPLIAVSLVSQASVDEPAEMNEYAEIDPWEGFNRSMFSFNESIDEYLLRPVAVGYKIITPSIIDKGITNFFGNIGDVISISNSLFQAKGGQAIELTTRVMFNTTFGLLGFFDVSTGFGLEKKKEDFGQTLAVWGVDSGPYLMLPFLGPSTIRDGSGRVVDIFLDPQYYMSDAFNQFVIKKTIWLIDARGDLLASENLIMGDKYTFIRNAYIQHREFLINDGEVDDPFAGEDFDDFEDF